MCVGEILCRFMCTIYTKRSVSVHLLHGDCHRHLCATYFLRNIRPSHSRAQNAHLRSQYTSCSTKYIYCDTHIFVVCINCVFVLGELLVPSPLLPPHFPAGCFHLTPPPPRNAILCMYVCNLKRLTKMDISRIKESNNAVTTYNNNSDNSGNAVKKRVHAIETTKCMKL